MLVLCFLYMSVFGTKKDVPTGEKVLCVGIAFVLDAITFCAGSLIL